MVARFWTPRRVARLSRALPSPPAPPLTPPIAPASALRWRPQPTQATFSRQSSLLYVADAHTLSLTPLARVSLEKAARRAAKASNKNGDPITCTSKLLAILPDPRNPGRVYVAESGGVVRRVTLEVRTQAFPLQRTSAPLTNCFRLDIRSTFIAATMCP